MTFKVKVRGLPPHQCTAAVEDHLIVRLLGQVVQTEVSVVRDGQADLTLVFPYYRFVQSPVVGEILDLAARKIHADSEFITWIVRRLFGVSNDPRILLVVPENLDHSPWDTLGSLLRHTSIPRATHWPKQLDPIGIRVPYWWNYVDWPSVPHRMSATSSRYGRWYPPEILFGEIGSLPGFNKRRQRAIWLTSHLSFPKSRIVELIEQFMPVDVVGGIPWGRKYDLLKTYQYAIATENSTGYGYETEKLPEARVAGCIPLGYIGAPLGDFARDAYFLLPPDELPEVLPPLQADAPDLGPLKEYLIHVINP